MSRYRSLDQDDDGPNGGLAVWLVGCIAAILFLVVYSLAHRADEHSDQRVAESVETASALEAQRQALADEMSANVRAAYDQGWREALVAVESTDRGEAFAAACGRMWQGRRP